MIELSDVSLSYPIIRTKSLSFQNKVYDSVGGYLGRQSSQTYVTALSKIDLRLTAGDRLGVIGHNGAGKSTLLNVLAGIYPPTTGKITTTGQVQSMIDFTLGMEADQSGLQNIMFRLTFMGFTRKAALKAANEIIEFAELGEFIHLPINTYSTGMGLRLAFAISTYINPDILILDEIIGAGDEAFQVKARERIDDVIGRANILILSSHNMSSIKEYCNRCVVLKKGNLLFDGDCASAIDVYQNLA